MTYNDIFLFCFAAPSFTLPPGFPGSSFSRGKIRYVSLQKKGKLRILSGETHDGSGFPGSVCRADFIFFLPGIFTRPGLLVLDSCYLDFFSMASASFS